MREMQDKIIKCYFLPSNWQKFHPSIEVMQGDGNSHKLRERKNWYNHFEYLAISLIENAHLKHFSEKLTVIIDELHKSPL